MRINSSRTIPKDFWSKIEEENRRFVFLVPFLTFIYQKSNLFIYYFLFMMDYLVYLLANRFMWRASLAMSRVLTGCYHHKKISYVRSQYTYEPCVD